MADREIRFGAAARAAAATQASLGVGFGVGAVLTLRHLREHGELPMTPFGFRAFTGPFERLGQEAFEALLAGFAAVCVMDIVAGALLWQRRRAGYLIGLVTAAPSLALSAGFALPIMLIGTPLRLALAVAGRRGLR